MKAERGYPSATVTPKAETAILRGHPWIYEAEILSMEGRPENGGLVEWKNVTKIVILKKLAIFYMGKVRAHLLPLDQIPEDADEAVELVKKYAKGIKVVNRRKSRRKRT